jgi:hypothetical protein
MNVVPVAIAALAPTNETLALGALFHQIETLFRRPRQSGEQGASDIAVALDSRFRGNDERYE